jgi:hypothetical protein
MSEEEKNDIELIDLDVIKPKPRQVKIQGKIIDISLIPFDVTLEMAEHFDTFVKLGKSLKGVSMNKLKAGEIDTDINGKSIKDALSLLHRCTVRILTNADPEITEEWVQKNVSSEQMMLLIQKMLEPLMEQWGTQKKIPGA